MVDVLFALSVFSFGFPSVFGSDITSVITFLDTLLLTEGNSWKGTQCTVTITNVIKNKLLFLITNYLRLNVIMFTI